MPNDHWSLTPEHQIVFSLHGKFDPIANPAHAWAVETWLFKKRDGIQDIYKRLGGDGDVYYVINGTEDFDDNLSAALAVLARQRGGK
jgi:hypothetical protein